ncbi:hypothetical protein HB904_09575 [Listeria booriae]|uniref:Uncharacterized protein n=1 Tax=Listeria booriae TaxID=1552123 RepID=A0A842AGE3_9LIST|nr:hypothetical protein [Listeria booriae]MBC1616437.1 hypothetical protein [Listeria booriae]
MNKKAELAKQQYDKYNEEIAYGRHDKETLENLMKLRNEAWEQYEMLWED